MEISVYKLVSIVIGYFKSYLKAAYMTYTASPKYFILYMACTIFNTGIVYLPMFSMRGLLNNLSNYLTGNANSETLLFIILFATLFFAVKVFGDAFSATSRIVSYKYNDALDFYLDNVLIEKVSKVDLAFFDSSKLNDKLNYITSVMRITTQAMTMDMLSFIRGIISLIVSLILICELEWWIAPIVVFASIPSIIGNTKKQKKEYEFKRAFSNSDRKLAYYKGLYFGNELQEIKLYGLNDFFSKQYTDVWNEWHRCKVKLNRDNFLWEFAGYLFTFASSAFILLYSMIKLLTGKCVVGDIVYYCSIGESFGGNFKSLCGTVPRLSRLIKDFGDVCAFIEMESKIESGGIRIPSQRPTIEFCNVSFKYPGTEKVILHNCSFKICYGETVGLVGLNGAGKSTIVKLLCRFYDPTEGRILIDGEDAREYDIVAMRKLFGVLFQDYVRYSFSLRENIALSDIEMISDDARIKLSCERSKVSDFIFDWDNGIDENMTRQFDANGKELSGGQWQRVSLARAFFRNAPVVLFDEPSAALDPAAEHEIFKDFAKVSEGKSALLISHRLSSITLCDKILVLEDGHIIEQGSHSELLARNGRYAYLFRLQAGKYI